MEIGCFSDTWRFHIEISFTDDNQDDLAPNELETEYEDLRLYLGYNIEYEGSQIKLFLTGRNLTTMSSGTTPRSSRILRRNRAEQ